ncbi:GDP Man:Man3GlcNAc2 PP Dol [Echinococcus multilocularis]|uniref:GDP-Man:Man(3)GlcNAc(2)-PP-Dol alpha-1,2-mannosyltransferase n=1 Tax=Echinococcus multilocularis TaxID=6211 RepID=A0A068YII4_ECHMU|nr:GDP Man:Man3GlcNAc2 PP Dol [Echinococcus multilocularis]
MLLLGILLWIFGWIIFVLGLLMRRQFIRKHWAKYHKMSGSPLLLSIFHPYCTSGGGGERVLWTGVNALLRHRPHLLIFIYTNDSDCLTAPSFVFQHVRNTFDIVVKDEARIHFVPLRSEPLLRPALYPFLTLAGQAIGSLIAGFEALIRLPSDIYLDTTGFAFTLPLFAWLLGARCGAYVHFPTVSSDMQRRVAARTSDSATSYNNAARIRKSRVLTIFKQFYYVLFRFAYGWAGSAVNCRLVAVNSTWTRRHIEELFGTQPYLLYPPCPCRVEERVGGEKRKPWIISIGQFRPEKNHMLQLKAFEIFLKCISGGKSPYRLILIGGCRHTGDYKRVRRLREAARQMGFSDRQVIFEVNPPASRVNQYLAEATINLHTMVDEHFGIGVVEGMAAGLVTVAHRSGGPLMDIIVPALARPGVDPGMVKPTPVGYLAVRPEEYAEVFRYILVKATPNQLEPLRTAARQRAQTCFSEEVFCKGWLNFVEKLEPRWIWPSSNEMRAKWQGEIEFSVPTTNNGHA